MHFVYVSPVMFQDICDGDSSILIALEMTESKEAMKEMKYAKQMVNHLWVDISLHFNNTHIFKILTPCQSHGAAITLRLCEACSITGSRRTVYGDSFFASMDTCIQLSANGNRYICIYVNQPITLHNSHI